MKTDPRKIGLVLKKPVGHVEWNVACQEAELFVRRVLQSVWFLCG